MIDAEAPRMLLVSVSVNSSHSLSEKNGRILQEKWEKDENTHTTTKVTSAGVGVGGRAMCKGCRPVAAGAEQGHVQKRTRANPRPQEICINEKYKYELDSKGTHASFSLSRCAHTTMSLEKHDMTKSDLRSVGSGSSLLDEDDKELAALGYVTSFRREFSNLATVCVRVRRAL